MDGTLNNMIDKLIDEYNDRYSDHIKLSDIKQYDFQRMLKPECKDIFSEFCNFTFMLDLDIADGAVEVLSDLATQHNIYFVTAGHPYTMGARDIWLRKHFDFYEYGMLVNCVDKRLLKMDILVDDYLDQFADGADYYGILFHQPWNEQDESITRIHSFWELPKLIDDETKVRRTA